MPKFRNVDPMCHIIIITAFLLCPLQEGHGCMASTSVKHSYRTLNRELKLSFEKFSKAGDVRFCANVFRRSDVPHKRSSVRKGELAELDAKS